MKLLENVPLRDNCWFKSGGVAEYFAKTTTIAELLEVATLARSEAIPFRVIGEGSNVLMSDSGMPGIIIQNQTNGMVFVHDRSQLIVETGTPVNQVVTKILSLGYSGLEFLAGMPGTIGGAVYGNASAFGCQIGDYVRSATLLWFGASRQEDGMRRVDREWFDFHHGGSTLKQLNGADHQEPPPILLSVTFQLTKMNHASCIKRVNQYTQIRKRIEPTSLLSLQVFDSLRIKGSSNEYDAITERKQTNVPVYFIEKAAMRHFHHGDISVSPDNPNFIINHGVGTSRDAARVIAELGAAADNQTGSLASCIEYIGMWD